MDVVIPTTISTSTFTRASTATYHDNTGAVTTSSANTLRINYDNSNLSLAPTPLIENGTTNYSFSEKFLMGNGLLSATGVTAEYYATLSPDNTLTAERLVEDTSNGIHGIKSSSGISGNNEVYSVYAKAAERSIIEIVAPAEGGDVWVFDLVAGTVSGAGTASSAAIFPEINGWFRCRVSALGNLSTAFVKVNIRNAGTNSYSGDGISGVYLWGQQTEVGTKATSYTPGVYIFSSRASAGSYIASTGYIANAATNVARINYTESNLALAPKLLLEPASTNLCLQSKAFNTTPWVSINTPGISTSPTADPFNSTNALSLSDTSGSLFSYTSQPVTITNDGNGYVFSCFIWKTTSVVVFPGIEMVLSSGSSPITVRASLNTNTGAAQYDSSENTPYYLRVDSYKGWWRLSIGLYNNTTGNTTLSLNLYPAASSTGTSWDSTLTGNSLFYGTQLEKASAGFSGGNKNLTRTSYISTTTATVTRAADTYTFAYGVRAADTYTNGLLYSNVPENDFALWNSATTYGIETGDGTNSVIYQHNRYASLRASNVNFNPATDTSSPPYWLLLGPTNQRNMFDTSPGTQTVGTVGGHIVVAVAIGALATLSFINMIADTVTIKLCSAYTLQNTYTLDFTGGSTGVPVTDYTLTNLPTFSDGYVLVDIYSATLAPTCGNLVTGTRYYLGSTGTETPATIGIIDYSIKSTDSFGNPTLTKRGYAKRMTTTSILDRSQQDLVSRVLSQARATPCVWNGNSSMANTTSNDETSLILYGFYQDWEITMTNPNQSYLAMTVQSLI